MRVSNNLETIQRFFLRRFFFPLHVYQKGEMIETSNDSPLYTLYVRKTQTVDCGLFFNRPCI